MFGFGRKQKRASIEDPRVPISDSNIVAFLGAGSQSAAGELVTIDSALGVPSIWAAVNFIPGTLAGLPLHLYRNTNGERQRVTTGLDPLLSRAVNDELTSFDWRKWLFEQALTHGRGLSFIERNASGNPVNIWPMEAQKTTVERKNGRKFYRYSENGKPPVTYEAREVIDVPFMHTSDLLRARSPIMTNVDVIGLAQAATKYGARFFANGGVSPFVLTGPFKTGGGVQRAADEVELAVRKASKQARQVLSLPEGHEIKSLGSDMDKMQFVELQRFLVEQIARIYSLPPTFLQDLTHGTFSNTEQQDLHFVKHTIKRWVEQFEQELNLKLLGRASTSRYIEMNLDGLLRGDFTTRMEGLGQAIQSGILKPNEARRLENRPDDPSGDKLMIQGATVPIENQLTPQEASNGA